MRPEERERVINEWAAEEFPDSSDLPADSWTREPEGVSADQSEQPRCRHCHDEGQTKNWRSWDGAKMRPRPVRNPPPLYEPCPFCRLGWLKVAEAALGNIGCIALLMLIIALLLALEG